MMIVMTRFLFHTPTMVASNFGDGLGRGGTLAQGDFSQAKHGMTGTMLCRSGRPRSSAHHQRPRRARGVQ
jgi:hypothetical protein